MVNTLCVPTIFNASMTPPNSTDHQGHSDNVAPGTKLDHNLIIKTLIPVIIPDVSLIEFLKPNGKKNNGRQ